MPIFNVNGGVGGSGGAIAEDMYFVSEDARDTFSATNPTRLQQGITCAVQVTPDSYSYFQWDTNTSSWRNADLIFQGRRGDRGDPGPDGAHLVAAGFQDEDIVFTDSNSDTFPLVGAKTQLQGEQGDPAPPALYQFSSTIDGPWVDLETFNTNPSGYQFWRVSPDEGETFTAPVRFRASVQDLPDGWGWFPSGDGGLQLRKGDALVLDVSEDELKSERFNILNSLLKFGASKAMYDAGENVTFVNVNSVDNRAYTPAWQPADSDSDWHGTIRNKGQQYARYNFDTFRPVDTSTTTSMRTVVTPTFDRRSYAAYINLPNPISDGVMTVSVGGRTFIRLEGVTAPAGESRLEYRDSTDQQPFIDLRQGVTYTVTLTDSEGNIVDSYAMAGLPSTPWFAEDTTAYSDDTIIDASMAGEGLQYLADEFKLTLTAGSNDSIGGFLVGTGLAVDEDGRLYSTVSGAIVKAVPDEAARLALPQITQAYTAIQTDVEQVFYLDADEDPSDNANWLPGGSTVASVTGFKGKGDVDPRSGVIEAKRGDYTSDEITVTDKTTGTKYVQVLDDGVMYLEAVT